LTAGVPEFELSIGPMTPAAARDASRWHYEAPYSIYDSTPETYELFLDPRHRYYALRDTAGELVGFCCFGADARVPGGRYRVEEREILDIGVGMRPERTGQGLGRPFLAAILDFARERFAPLVFRATIAEFNQRSARTFAGLGFAPVQRFARADGMAFCIWERPEHDDSA
jgi:ribosomal-protein-alanine N-acetyltransferase